MNRPSTKQNCRQKSPAGRKSNPGPRWLWKWPPQPGRETNLTATRYGGSYETTAGTWKVLKACRSGRSTVPYWAAALGLAPSSKGDSIASSKASATTWKLTPLSQASWICSWFSPEFFAQEKETAGQPQKESASKWLSTWIGLHYSFRLLEHGDLGQNLAWVWNRSHLS